MTFSKPMKLPYGRKAINGKWIFKTKLNQDGTLDKFKARLVAQGYSQREGIDYEEVFAPVIGITTLRILLSICAKSNLIFRTIDINSAYLYADIDKEIYMNIPEGYNGNFTKGDVLKLEKGLYGLKQAGKLWYEELRNTILSIGFKQSIFDPGLYNKIIDCNKYLHIAVYVDDIFMVGTDLDTIHEFISTIKRYYQLKEGKIPSELLNIMLLDGSEGIHINQSKFTMDVIEKFKMTSSTPSKTPLTPGFCSTSNAEPDIEVPYLELIGSIGYLAKTSRPDISFAYSYLGRFCKKPNLTVWKAAKKVLRYLLETKNYSLKYRKDNNSKAKIVAYSDASFANTEDGKSTTGYCIFYGENLIYWKSKKQSVPSTSTTEAEIYALLDCVKESLYLRQLIDDTHVNNGTSDIDVYCDNKAAIQIITNEVINGKTKHIMSNIAFLRHYMKLKSYNLLFVQTENNLADILTKAANSQVFKSHAWLLGLSGVLEIDTSDDTKGSVSEQIHSNPHKHANE